MKFNKWNIVYIHKCSADEIVGHTTKLATVATAVILLSDDQSLKILKQLILPGFFVTEQQLLLRLS